MDHQLDKLAFKYFKVFAQCESTLKELGFFQARRNGTIIVDWDRFANEVVGSTFEHELVDMGEGVDYILTNPPMRQVVNDQGKIEWKEVLSSDKTPQAFINHLCRIRNNLFHGSKFNGTWFAPERSMKLLESALPVLTYYRKRLKGMNEVN